MTGRRAPARLAAACRVSLALLAMTVVCACGKKGPNQPPIRILPGAAQGLKARQIGQGVVLTARLPMQETDGTPLTGPVQVRVLRMPATDTLRPGFVSARYLQHQFERSAQTLTAFKGDEAAKAAPAGALVYHDDAVPAGVPVRLLYSVLIIDGRGRRSPLPLPVMVEIVKPPAPPHDLRLETAEGVVHLTWMAGEGDKSAGPFNIYRDDAAATAEPLVPLNPQPVPQTTYDDTLIVYGQNYRYLIRAACGNKTLPCESADSPVVTVRPLDIYPPKMPTGVAVSAEGPVIRVYWFPNSETDLTGYRIYRRDSPQGEFVLIGEVGPNETAFADTTVRPGVRYHYAVSAFDGAAPRNESPRSEEHAETVPIGGAPTVPGHTPVPKPGPGPSPTPAPGPSPTPAPGPSPTPAPQR